MEQTITLEMDEAVRNQVKTTRIKPPYCKYPVMGIPWEIIPYPDCEIARQKVGYLGTHLQLAESLAKKKVEHKFNVSRPMAYLVFMLEGAITVRNFLGQVVSDIKSGTYLMTYIRKQAFSYTWVKGKQSIIVVSLDRDWFLPVRDRYTEFQTLIDSWQNEIKGEVVLPHCAIGQRTNHLLETIRTSPVKTLENGIEITNLLVGCINIYHDLLLAKRQLPENADEIQAKRLKKYLRENFAFDEMCRLKTIEVKLGLTQWKIRQLSLQYLGMPVQKYLLKIRMERAMVLLNATKLKIRKVAMSVGYADSAYFTRVYKAYFGKLPRDVKATDNQVISPKKIVKL